jgi:hypothetical protein
MMLIVMVVVMVAMMRDRVWSMLTRAFGITAPRPLPPCCRTHPLPLLTFCL